MAVAVISASGKRLMPTNEYKARHLLKNGRAKIYRYRPVFTIQLTDREDGDVQPIEYKCDTGYQHVGISIASENREYVHDQNDMLPDETEKHADSSKYRRGRRNRKRYRAPRFNNRTHGHDKSDKWFAPSVRHREENQIRLFRSYAEIMPIVSAVFEIGEFDTQVLKAVLEGKPLPEGTDYQRGEQYGTDTLRAAVFTRDSYTCRICGRSIPDGAILHIHHVGFWKGDRTNRPDNLMTVCEKCHTSKNHKPGGKLYGLQPTLPPLTGATYMTAVRWDMYYKLKAMFPDIAVHLTYGVTTKRKRQGLNIKKTHANDAYAMGKFHPAWKADARYFQKKRRNNRILSKFYDAKYIDIRTGEKKPGSSPGSNRTKRNIPRSSEQNERKYRGRKVSKGHTNIRRKHYSYQKGDLILWNGRIETVSGMQNKGTRIVLCRKTEAGKQISINVNNAVLIRHTDGWVQLQEPPEE